MKITPTNESPDEVKVEVNRISSLTPINGTYFESQGLKDDEDYENETI